MEVCVFRFFGLTPPPFFFPRAMLAAAARRLARRRLPAGTTPYGFGTRPTAHGLGARPPPLTATSLASALHLAPTGRLHAIDLTASDDCRCVNLMCEHVGGPCACRVGAALDRVAARGGAATVVALSLARNGLASVPAAVGELRLLTRLDLSGNELVSVGEGAAIYARLHALRTVDVSGMPGLTDVTGLTEAPSLAEVVVSRRGEAAEVVSRVGHGRWRVVVVDD